MKGRKTAHQKASDSYNLGVSGGKNMKKLLIGILFTVVDARLEGFEPTTLGSEDRCSVR